MQFVYHDWDLVQEKAPDLAASGRVVERPRTENGNGAFGSMLQEERIKKRMTIDDVAEATGFDAKTVMLFERGSEVPSTEVQGMFRRVLGAPR